MRVRAAILFSFLLPPLGLILAGRPVAAALNVPLTLCLWLPGCVHALIGVYAWAERRQPLVLADVVAHE